jgi:hypothetical protein
MDGGSGCVKEKDLANVNLREFRREATVPVLVHCCSRFQHPSI